MRGGMPSGRRIGSKGVPGKVLKAVRVKKKDQDLFPAQLSAHGCSSLVDRSSDNSRVALA
jgi:hypothetical protein